MFVHSFILERCVWSSARLSKRFSSLVPVVGLEIHMQILSNSKLFSSTQSVYGGAPNHYVGFFDAALPGTLPLLNRYCVECAVKAAAALNCTINNNSYFERKHYFYADMPAGYQITQQQAPIAVNGSIPYLIIRPGSHTPIEKTAHIKQIQIEQDSGKSIHDPEHHRSLIDLNRAGVGLLEIVFEPCFCNGEEAYFLVKELVKIAKTLEISSCKMDEGAVRVDANVSVHVKDSPLGTRTEVKNLNSVKAVKNAIDFEISRQIQEVSKGNRIVNQTMSFDSEKGVTVPMRDKEVVQDYRFMIDPNIPPLVLDKSGILVDEIRQRLPELPDAMRKRLCTKYNIPLWQSAILVNEQGFFDFFDAAMQIATDPKITLNMLLITLIHIMNQRQLDSLDDVRISPEQLGLISKLISDRIIYSGKAEDLIISVIDQDSVAISPLDIVKEKNWFLISDEKVLLRLADDVISEFPKEVVLIRKGKDRPLNKLMASVRERTNGCIDLKLFKNILLERLK